jgi:hypothetical protein
MDVWNEHASGRVSNIPPQDGPGTEIPVPREIASPTN